ncbi:hypothetical protein VNO78_23450 [Psophocarpus tetragonolobus]|uniref:Uncharacterized protein n=1 Tax=Psophocarpus tetragonolobus TaxID=3891 RepID=A0AAN9S3K4_PSOTE
MSKAETHRQLPRTLLAANRLTASRIEDQVMIHGLSKIKMANTKIIRCGSVVGGFVGHDHDLVTVVKDGGDGHHGRPYNGETLIKMDGFEESGITIDMRTSHGSTMQNVELSSRGIRSISHKFFVV